MDIELKELSNIYLQTLKEEEDGAAGEGQNPQQSADVGAHAKAIRYQARRDNVPLPKAFNDYVSKNQLSGTERTALRQKLGFMGEETIVEKKGCNHTKKGEECPEHGIKDCPMDEQEHKIGGGNLKKLASKANKRVDADVDGDVDTKDMKSSETGEFVPGPDGKKLKSKFRAEHVSWRTELSEYTDASPKAKTDEKSREKITEKKVKNKIVINPPQGMTEAIEELGGQILEMIEIEEAVYGGTPKKKEEPKDDRYTVTAADKKGNTPAYQNYKKGDKRYKAADHMGEEAGDADARKAEAMRKKQLSSREQMMKKQHLLDKQRMQAQKSLRMPSGHMEELSIDQQMKISRDHNRKSPEEKLAANKKALGTIKKVKREKDTRTDAQKMTDATGPRPGSRYRGD